MTETFAEPTLVLERPDRPPVTAGRVFRAILRAPFEARTWKELVYLVAALLLGMIAVVWLFGGFGVGLYSSIVLIGIPLLALVLLGGRIWGHVYRAVGSVLLDTPMPAPPPFAPRPGLLGWLRSAFTDRTSWRALVFLIAEVVLGMVGGYLLLVAIVMTVFTAISPIPWAVFHPINVDEQGREHHSLAQFGDYYIETWPRVLGLAAIGVIGCFVLPWIVRGVCWLHRQLSLALLTPTAHDRRLVELQESRKVAVQDSAATLRRMERDLHDGTQARLVTIAMALGRAEERIAAGGDATELIADAHASSKEALAELRELVRGIHPPALELGLEPALETLTARCAVPVDLHVQLPQRPNPAIEAIAYFTVAELLTNVVKHSGAAHASVDVRAVRAGAFAVTVRDDGHGGALQPPVPTGDTAVSGGLSGLAARAKAVDGTLTVDSPAGGPTVVTVVLPTEGPR
ncbi:signal transduction histidine kinase [Nocardia transvalensis]|uniref:histidine kinase n=1 Tax=Nocardia transvalensis TaxID=37333 RepID=A0A7W9UI83_9NOCA|nr:sensor domain-containing protein [Nocardia transvalensis]MBB5914134.1 signal transduction histidine kinase [Nocardia transvalensis]